jgi:DNA-binding MarR family transcriptional regulator
MFAAMAELPSDPMIAAWVALFRASAGLIAAVQADVKAAGCPPVEWYDVLWELEQAPEPGRRPFELKERLLLAQYNLSRLVDRLTLAGLVEKHPCPGDGRGHMLRITDAGRTLRQQTWPIYQAAILRHVGAHLTATEATEVSGMLARLIDGLRAGSVPGDANEGPACPQGNTIAGAAHEL